MEKLQLFNKRLIDIRSDSKSSITTKKNELMKLQHDLKKNYIASYEYKMLEMLIQEYSDNLNKKSKSRSDRNKSSSPYKKKAGFGNTILEMSKLRKHKRISTIQNVYEENIQAQNTNQIFRNIIQLNIKDYLYKGTEYKYDNIPFIGTVYIYTICHAYLYKKHQQITNADKESTRRVAKPLEIFYLTMDGVVQYINGEFICDDTYFLSTMLGHFRRMDNAFTMFIGCTSNHAVSVFVQKVEKKVFLYVVDSNHKPVENIIELKDALTEYFTDRLGIQCYSKYIATHLFNFGNNNEFESAGYCMLMSLLFIEIMYDNMVIYKNISYDSNPGHIIYYLTSILNYLNNTFVKKKQWHYFIQNYAYKVLGDMEFFHEDENKPVPKYFTVATLLDIFQYKNKDSPYTSDDFKIKFLEFTAYQHLYCRTVGINWKSRNKSDVKKPQKDNNFEYFIPEDFNEKNSHAYKNFKFKSLVREDFFLYVTNRGDSVTTEDHKHIIRDYTDVMEHILFLFIDMVGYLKHITKEDLFMSLIYEHANFSAIIEKLNRDLDQSKIPTIENDDYIINSKNLLKIALIYKKRKIKITRFMSSILWGILDKKPSHVRFWDSVKHMTPESFGEYLRQFIENELHFTFKYTMVNLGNDTFSGYWVAPDEMTEGIDYDDINERVRDQLVKTIPDDITNKMFHILDTHNYTGLNNVISIVMFIKSLGPPTNEILYKIPMVYFFPSTKYNDRLFA